MSQTLYVGTDMSKASFEASASQGAETRALGNFTNTSKGYQQLAQRLAAAQEEEVRIHLIVEPTGGYELPLVAFAFEQGWAVSLPNPKQVRDWAKAMGVRAKNDNLDSRVLAAFAAASQPTPQNQLPAEIAALDSLLRRREELRQMVRQERNRQQALTYRPDAAAATRASVERLMRLLEKELDQVEAAIDELLEDNPDLKAEARLLRTVSGIGRETVLPILVLLHRWRARTAGWGTAKGLVAFAGLDPQEFRSGQSVAKRATISKMGCTFTRSKLYMAAQGGVRATNSPLRHFYDRLRGRGKPYRLTLVAAARKILVWAFVVFSRRVPFDPSLHATPSA